MGKGLNNQVEILIIGGGVIGVCAAHFLTQRGRSVTLLEKGEICAGSSYGNAGLIALSHLIPHPAPGVIRQGLRWMFDADSPFYIKPRADPELLRWLWEFRGACNTAALRRSVQVLLNLCRESNKLYEKLAACDELEFGYEHRGRLFLFTNKEALQKAVEQADLVKRYGVAAEVLDAASVRRLEPNILPTVIAGIHYPENAHINPDRFVKQMARLVAGKGARLQTNTEVLGFETSGKYISTVITTQGTFSPDQVVLAAGAWSPILARKLGIRLPIQPAKGYSITTRRPSDCPRLSLFLDDGKVAVTPFGERLRFTSTLELSGYDLSINRRRLAAIRRSASKHLAGMDALEPLEQWSGLRPLTPDDLPIIGRSQSITNLIVATGHGTLGMTQGPITGRLVAQIAAGEAPSIDLAALRVERFAQFRRITKEAGSKRTTGRAR